MININYENITCPICDNDLIEEIYCKDINEVCVNGIIKTKINLSICKRCGMVFQNPSPTTNSLNKFYSLQSEVCDKNTIIREWYYDMYDFIKKYSDYNNIRKVLDIGCRRGELLRLFKKDNKYVYGIEPSKKNAEYVYDNFHIPVKIGMFDQNIIKEKFDLITLTNALEHIKNPSIVIENIHRRLNNNGYLYINVPNFKSCLNKKFFSNIADYFCFQHLQYFTCENLKFLLNKSGFVQESMVITDEEITILCRKQDNINYKGNMVNQYEQNNEIVKKYLKLRESNIEKIINQIYKLNKKNLIIYGAGAHTTQLMQNINFDDFNLIAICDSDSNKYGMELGGYTVQYIDDIDKNKFSHILISSNAYEQEIYNFLVKKFPEKDIVRLYL